MTWVVGWCSIGGMTAKFRLEELARQLGGEAFGEAGVEIRGVRPFEQAGSGDLTLATQRKLCDVAVFTYRLEPGQPFECG